MGAQILSETLSLVCLPRLRGGRVEGTPQLVSEAGAVGTQLRGPLLVPCPGAGARVDAALGLAHQLLVHQPWRVQRDACRQRGLSIIPLDPSLL